MDAAKLYKLGQTDLNVAWGVEVRREGYAITAGEPTSYNRLTGSSSTLTAGAQGFIGFQPSNVLKADRISNAVYLDLEAKLPSILTLGAAVRGEHYSDFGDIVTGKLSGRADLAKWFALRATASTGFRAPSLQQQYFTSTASVLSGGVIVETGTFPSISTVGASLGGLPLRPEKSFNLSAGAVVRAGGFDLTVDGYVIRIRDQLGLSENITLSSANQTLYGVQAARFFINGLHTTTKGIDIVGHYKLRTEKVGTFDLTASANFNTITVDSYPTSPSATLFARQRILTIAQGTPGEKVVGSVDWSLGKVSATARVSYYGDVNQPASAAVSDLHTGKHTITDLEARYKLLPQATLAIGANNVFDIYPNKVPLLGTDGTTAVLATNGGVAFPFFSPFGFNGRYLFAKLNLSW
jgi:iron complex outermembrane receptor protein